MQLIRDEDLDKISGGGTNITGTLVSAIGDVMRMIYQAGHAVGSSVRRMSDNKLCPIK
jgi:hypothetical protein